MVFQKTLFYIAQTPVTRFHFDQDPTWCDRFQTECRNLSRQNQVHYGQLSSKIRYVAILFKSLADEALFSQAFYISGAVKNIFKESMRYSKTHRIAFSMTNIHLGRLEDYSRPFDGFRVVSCDIKPHRDTKFFDALPEKKRAVPLLKDIFAYSKTLSCSGYYGFEDEFKHVQTQYVSTDPKIFDDIRKILAKYPEQTYLRDNYNASQEIRCLRTREVRSMMPCIFYFDEIRDRIPEELGEGMETPLFL